MAAPTRNILQKRRTASDGNLSPEVLELLNQLAERKEAVTELIEVIGLLYEKGWLRTVKAFLAAGDEILAIGLEQLNTPGGKRLLRNLIHMGVLLSAIDLPSAAKTAEEEEKERERPGLWTLFQTLRDPEVVSAVRFFLHVIKRVYTEGSATIGEETR